jgi:hypothetical protein
MRILRQPGSVRISASLRAASSPVGRAPAKWSDHLMFDFDPGLAEATRRRMLDRVAADRARVTGYHFPFPAHGFIAWDGGTGYCFIPSNWMT